MKNAFDVFLAWFKESTVVTDANNGAVSIALPLLDRYNDYIQIFVKSEGDDVFITDDGAIISNLRMSGIDISDGGEIRKRINNIANYYFVEVSGKDEIQVRVKKDKFVFAFTGVLQAMLSIDALFYAVE